MKLPKLDQLVPLERGEASLLARAVTATVQEITQAQKPVPFIEMLTLAPLVTLGKKLLGQQRREVVAAARPPVQRKRQRRLPPPKPWQCRVSYDQLVALHLHRYALPYCNLSEAENLQLRAILGKFQQKALNLSAWVRFT